jgi:hypothetical protein
MASLAAVPGVEERTEPGPIAGRRIGVIADAGADAFVVA